MAGKRLPRKSLGKSALYYRSNPKARKVKAKKDTEINKRKSQRSKRSELVKERRKRKIYGKGGSDVSHTKNGLVMKSPKKNRGSKSDSNGDVRSRGGKKK